MDHLYRELAPVSESGLGADRGRGQEPPRHPPGRAQAGGPGRAARLGPLRHRSRAGRRGGQPRRRACAALQRRVLPLVELRAEFAVSREELDDADRGAADIDLPELDEAVRQIAVGRERRPSSTAIAAAGMLGHHRVQLAPADHLRGGHGAVPEGGGPGGRRAAPEPGSAAPTGSPSAPRSTRASWRRPSTAATCCFDHLRQILGGPAGVGARRRGRRRGEPARRRLRHRLRTGPLHRLPGARRRGRPPLRRGEPQLPRATSPTQRSRSRREPA